MDYNTHSIDPDNLRQRSELLEKECIRIQQQITDLQAEKQKMSKNGELVKKVLATALLIREQHILGQKINHEIHVTKQEQDKYQRENAILEDNISFLKEYNSINAEPQRLLRRITVKSARDALNARAYQKFIDRDDDACQQEIDQLNEEIRQLERKISLFDNAKDE
ncbi:hypothetical protein BDF22DRAFT_742834 [Syncephalis plumigaleata]|nr:hypothetical protein BDF22DRAFT_742834 [Syncephalis plumigaleata]